MDVEFHDPERSMKNFIREGIFSQITLSLLTATIISSYLAVAGADSFVIGVLVAIPYMTTIAQIVSAKFVEKRSRKKIAVFASFIANNSVLAIAIVSFINGPYEILAFAIFYLIFNICEDLLTVSWSSWTRDLVFGAKMGEKLSKRLAYGKIAAIPFFILQIWLFEKFDKSAFPILFFLAFLAGIISVYFLRNIEDVKSRRISEPSLIKPLQNSSFLKWTLLNSAFCFSLSASRSFFAVYILQVLGYPIWFIFLFAFVAHISSIYSLRLAGTISDRFGNKPLLAISIASFIFSTILFILSEFYLSLYLLLLAYVLHGFYTSAPGIAFMNAVADMTHRKHSAPFYAIGNWMQDFFSALGSIFGGLMLAKLAFLGGDSYIVLFTFSFTLSLFLFPFLRFYDEFGQPTWIAVLNLPRVFFEDLGKLYHEMRKFIVSKFKKEKFEL
ncbi:MAG: MFS transporter [Archaeoglobaceae archaeon]|nr:MFS transporter [Archaeoglobaceae archaeon]MDW8118868.1 MFS transporter [Archaeoglobaceae archaeon]